MLYMGQLKGLNQLKSFILALENNFDDIPFNIFRSLLDNAALEYGSSVESVMKLKDTFGSSQEIVIKQDYSTLDKIFNPIPDEVHPDVIGGYKRDFLYLSNEDHGHNLGIGVGVCSGDIHFQWTTRSGHELIVRGDWQYGLIRSEMISIEEGREPQPTDHMEFNVLVGHDQSETFYPIIADLVVGSGGNLADEG